MTKRFYELIAVTTGTKNTIGHGDMEAPHTVRYSPLRASLPWAVRANPERYPFMLPDDSVPFCCRRVGSQPPSSWLWGFDYLRRRVFGGGAQWCCHERASCATIKGNV